VSSKAISTSDGTGMAAAAIFCGVFSGMLLKLADSMPGTEAMALRATLALLIVGGIVVFGRGRLQGNLGIGGLVRALLDAIAGLCFALAIFELPLSMLAAVHATLPLFSTVLSAIILKEKVRRSGWLGLVIGLVGVAAILQPSAAISPLGIILAFVSTLAYAFRDLATRTMSPGQDPMKSICLSLALMAGFSWVLALRTTWAEPIWSDLLMVGAAAVSHILASTLIIRAIKIAGVSRVAILRYTNILWSLLFDALLWHTVPPLVAWIGIGLIVASSIVVRLHLFDWGTKTRL